MWIAVTIIAAVLLTWRTALQHRLRSVFSVSGAGFVRYVYGAPVALAAVAAVAVSGHALPSPPARFWPTIAAAGAAQVVATMLLIAAFDAAGFAVGTIYSKTEVVQTALLSMLLLGETLGPAGWLATACVFVGVVGLATTGGTVRPAPTDIAASRPAVIYGLGAGAFFGLTAIAIRSSSQSLGAHPAVVRAILTVAVMNTMQTVMQGTYLLFRDRRQLQLAVRHWRSSSVVGLLSVCGSAGWALAFSLQNASKVRTVGQVELLFTFAASRFWLRDRLQWRQVAASALVIVGVVVLIAWG